MQAILDYLRTKYAPCALILYGSYADGSTNAHSDFDALAMVEEGEPSHDHEVIQGVQLDVFLYPRRMFSGDFDPAEFLAVYDGSVLWDTENLASALIQRVRAYVQAQPGKSDAENGQQVAWCRKMALRAARGDAEGWYRLHWLLTDSLEIYFGLKHWPYFGPKKGLRRMQREDVPAAELYGQALREGTLPAVRAWVEHLATLLPSEDAAEKSCVFSRVDD